MPTPVLTYTLGFTLNQDQTVGSMTLTDTTDWASYGLNPADIEISWGYNGPDGNPYFVAAVGSTWSIFPAISTSASLPLPLSFFVNDTAASEIYTASLSLPPKQWKSARFTPISWRMASR